MDQLPNARLALGRADLAVEILAARRRSWPVGSRSTGDFAVGLLEEHLARFALDGGRAHLPLDGVERIGDSLGAKCRIDHQTAWKTAAGLLLGCAGHGRPTLSRAHVLLGHLRASFPVVYRFILHQNYFSAGSEQVGYHSRPGAPWLPRSPQTSASHAIYCSLVSRSLQHRVQEAESTPFE